MRAAAHRPRRAPPAVAAVLAAAALAVAASAPADDGGVIVGRVFDRRNVSRLPFAAILVRSLPPRWGASADDEGRFLIDGVPGGSWDLEVSSPDHGRVVGSVPVAAGETTEVSVTLGPPGDTLFAAARFGPRAPFISAFPRARELEGEGLIGFWYSDELPRAVGFSDDGDRLALETKSGVSAYRVRSGHLQRDLQLRFPPPGPADVALAFGRDGILRLRQAGVASTLAQEPDAGFAARPVRRLVGSAAGGLYRMSFAADRARLATWPAGGTSVTVWRLPEGAEVATLATGVEAQAAAFTRDRTLVVVGGAGRSNVLEVWSHDERRLLGAVPARAGGSGVRSLAVDPGRLQAERVKSTPPATT